MKLNSIFGLVFVLVIVACAPITPDVAITPEVTATFTPSPVLTATKMLTSEPTLPPTAEVGIDFSKLEQGVQHNLSGAELSGLKMEGKGFAVVGQYEGVDVPIVIVESNGLLATVDGGKGVMLNPNYPAGESSPADRLAQAVLAGHWRGYQEDHGAISFANFVAKLKAGEDMSYTLAGTSVGSISLGEIVVDPSKLTEIVGTVNEHDPNGDSWVHHTSAFGYGFYVTDEGGLRLIVRVPKSYDDPDKMAYIFMTHTGSALWTLGLDEVQQSSGSDLNRSLPKDIDKYYDSKFIDDPMFYVSWRDPAFKWGDTVIVAGE